MKTFIKNFLSFAAFGFVWAGASAETFTLDEIFGGSQQIAAIESKQKSTGFENNVVYRYPNVTSLYNGSFGVTMERVPGSDTKVKISGICFTAFDPETTFSFIFTLCEGGVESARGSQLVLGKNETSLEDNRTKLQCAEVRETIDWSTMDNAYYYVPVNADLYFNITKKGDGTFNFKSQTYPVYLNSPNLSYPTFLGGSCHFSTDILEFDTYESNTMATETFDHWQLTDYASASAVNDYSSTRTYRLALDMNYNTKVCTIRNFANQGFMLNQNGKQSDLVGTINTTAKTVTFKAVPGYIEQAKYKEMYSPWQLYTLEYRLCTWTGVDGGAVTEGAVAKYDERTDVHHNDSEHAWVTNGGKRRTWGGETLTFDKPILFFNNTSGPHSSGTIPMDFGSGFKGWNFGQYVPRASAVYRDMVIGEDVTLDINLKINNYGVDEDNVYVNATLNEVKNEKYVKNYELYMVPGRFNSITDAGFSHDIESGHVDAVCVSDFANTWTPKNRVADMNPDAARPNGGVGSHTFNVVVPADELGGATDATKGYTIFVKANYRDNMNLAPTFHNLTYVTTNTTGVGSMTAESPVVSAESGTIVIEGSDAEAAVYTPSGALVYQGAGRTIAVAPGLYIVRVGSTSTKVLVK